MKISDLIHGIETEIPCVFLGDDMSVDSVSFKICNVAWINAPEGEKSYFYKVVKFTIKDGKETHEWGAGPEFLKREDAEKWLQDNDATWC